LQYYSFSGIPNPLGIQSVKDNTSKVLVDLLEIDDDDSRQTLTMPGIKQRAFPSMKMQDIQSLRRKFPFLADFTDEFVATTPLDALLKTETTAIKLKELERTKNVGVRLTSNRDQLANTFIEIKQGADNRWNHLHESRFLPGAGCPATKLWLKARELADMYKHAPISTYDMGAIGLGGFVSKRGWVELHDVGSDSLSLKLFNINSCGNKVTSTSSNNNNSNEEYKEINDLGEFKLALRVAREALSYVHSWNKSIAALEGFMYQTDYCKEDLVGTEKPAHTLTQFVDYVFGENADRWRGMQPFLTTGDLRGVWASFWGARPESKLKKSTYQKGAYRKKGAFIWDPNYFDDICRMFNLGKCSKAPGTCTTKSGIPLRHVCNHRANPSNPQDVCGKNHVAIQNH